MAEEEKKEEDGKELATLREVLNGVYDEAVNMRARLHTVNAMIDKVFGIVVVIDDEEA